MFYNQLIINFYFNEPTFLQAIKNIFKQKADYYHTSEMVTLKKYHVLHSITLF